MKKEAYFKTLPSELISLLAQYLDDKSKFALSSTCKTLFYHEDLRLGAIKDKISFYQNKLAQLRMTVDSGKGIFVYDNNIYVWGLYSEDHHMFEMNPHFPTLPCKLATEKFGLFENEHVAQFSCGDQHFALLTSEGRCFTWGNNYLNQLGFMDRSIYTKPVELTKKISAIAPNCKIKQFLAGEAFTLFLTENGDIYIAGWGRDGQLGLSHCRITFGFEKVNLSQLALDKDNLPEKVITANKTVVVLTQKKQCIVWGWNAHGQLGLGYNSDRSIPMLLNIKLASDDAIKDVAIGMTHTLLLTEKGRCFASGKNNYGQLGLGDTLDRNIFTEINISLSKGDKIVNIASGLYHSVVLTAHGRLFCWGFNEFYQLGAGHNNNIITANEGELQIGLHKAEKIIKVIAGKNYIMLLTTVPRIYVFGDNRFRQLGLNAADTFLKVAKRAHYHFLTDTSADKEKIARLQQIAAFRR